MPTGNGQVQRGQRGFTYLLLLFLLAIGGAGLAVVGERQQALVQREREAELRFRGEAIARAIQRYAEQGPPGQAVLPTHLEALLEDRRGPRIQRPLRQIYADPFTGKPDWELVYGLAPLKAADPADGAPAAEGGGVPLRGIVGVRSRSTRRLFNLQWPQLPGRPKSAVAADLPSSPPARRPRTTRRRRR